MQCYSLLYIDVGHIIDTAVMKYEGLIVKKLEKYDVYLDFCSEV